MSAPVDCLIGAGLAPSPYWELRELLERIRDTPMDATELRQVINNALGVHDDPPR